MPETKKNALAKLAEKLKADVGIVRAFKKDLGDKEDEVGGMMIDDIDKASLIVAELAKVRWWRSPSRWMPRGNNVSDILIKCRAIAEEREVRE